MDLQERLRKIMEAANCTIEVAKSADKASNNSLQKAIEIARSKQSLYKNTAVKHIVEYSNGILINNEFYDYKDKENCRLKDMLKRGEFDREILGECGSHAEVMYSDKTKDFYTVGVRKSEHFVGSPKQIQDGPFTEINVPDLLKMDGKGKRFKIMIGEKRVTVIADGNRTVGDFLSYLKKFVPGDIVILKGENAIDPKSCIDEIVNTLVVAKLAR